jgi:amino acid permease
MEGYQQNAYGQTLLLLNVASGTLGAGALSLPFAFREGGILLGVGVMLFLLYFSIVSIRLIVQSIELGRRGMPHFAVHGRNFIPLFYGASGMFLRPRKTPL